MNFVFKLSILEYSILINFILAHPIDITFEFNDNSFQHIFPTIWNNCVQFTLSHSHIKSSLHLSSMEQYDRYKKICHVVLLEKPFYIVNHFTLFVLLPLLLHTCTNYTSKAHCAWTWHSFFSTIDPLGIQPTWIAININI